MSGELKSRSSMLIEKNIAQAKVQLSRIFREFDEDGNGELTEDEHRKMLTKILRVQRRELANSYGGIRAKFSFISKEESEAFIRSTPRIEFK